LYICIKNNRNNQQSCTKHYLYDTVSSRLELTIKIMYTTIHYTATNLSFSATDRSPILLSDEGFQALFEAITASPKTIDTLGISNIILNEVQITLLLETFGPQLHSLSLTHTFPQDMNPAYICAFSETLQNSATNLEKLSIYEKTPPTTADILAISIANLKKLRILECNATFTRYLTAHMPILGTALTTHSRLIALLGTALTTNPQLIVAKNNQKQSLLTLLCLKYVGAADDAFLTLIHSLKTQGLLPPKALTQESDKLICLDGYYVPESPLSIAAQNSTLLHALFYENPEITPTASPILQKLRQFPQPKNKHENLFVPILEPHQSPASQEQPQEEGNNASSNLQLRLPYRSNPTFTFRSTNTMIGIMIADGLRGIPMEERLRWVSGNPPARIRTLWPSSRTWRETWNFRERLAAHAAPALLGPFPLPTVQEQLPEESRSASSQSNLQLVPYPTEAYRQNARTYTQIYLLNADNIPWPYPSRTIPYNPASSSTAVTLYNPEFALQQRTASNFPILSIGTPAVETSASALAEALAQSASLQALSIHGSPIHASLYSDSDNEHAVPFAEALAALTSLRSLNLNDNNLENLHEQIEHRNEAEETKEETELQETKEEPPIEVISPSLANTSLPTEEKEFWKTIICEELFHSSQRGKSTDELIIKHHAIVYEALLAILQVTLERKKTAASSDAYAVSQHMNTLLDSNSKDPAQKPTANLESLLEQLAVPAITDDALQKPNLQQYLTQNESHVIRISKQNIKVSDLFRIFWWFAQQPEFCNDHNAYPSAITISYDARNLLSIISTNPIFSPLHKTFSGILPQWQSPVSKCITALNTDQPLEQASRNSLLLLERLKNDGILTMGRLLNTKHNLFNPRRVEVDGYGIEPTLIALALKNGSPALLSAILTENPELKGPEMQYCSQYPAENFSDTALEYWKPIVIQALILVQSQRSMEAVQGTREMNRASRLTNLVKAIVKLSAEEDVDPSHISAANVAQSMRTTDYSLLSMEESIEKLDIASVSEHLNILNLEQSSPLDPEFEFSEAMADLDHYESIENASGEFSDQAINPSELWKIFYWMTTQAAFCRDTSPEARRNICEIVITDCLTGGAEGGMRCDNGMAQSILNAIFDCDHFSQLQETFKMQIPAMHEDIETARNRFLAHLHQSSVFVISEQTITFFVAAIIEKSTACPLQKKILTWEILFGLLRRDIFKYYLCATGRTIPTTPENAQQPWKANFDIADDSFETTPTDEEREYLSIFSNKMLPPNQIFPNDITISRDLRQKFLDLLKTQHQSYLSTFAKIDLKDLNRIEQMKRKKNLQTLLTKMHQLDLLDNKDVNVIYSHHFGPPIPPPGMHSGAFSQLLEMFNQPHSPVENPHEWTKDLLPQTPASIKSAIDSRKQQLASIQKLYAFSIPNYIEKQYAFSQELLAICEILQKDYPGREIIPFPAWLLELRDGLSNLLLSQTALQSYPLPDGKHSAPHYLISRSMLISPKTSPQRVYNLITSDTCPFGSITYLMRLYAQLDALPVELRQLTENVIMQKVQCFIEKSAHPQQIQIITHLLVKVPLERDYFNAFQDNRILEAIYDLYSTKPQVFPQKKIQEIISRLDSRKLIVFLIKKSKLPTYTNFIKHIAQEIGTVPLYDLALNFLDSHPDFFWSLGASQIGIIDSAKKHIYEKSRHCQFLLHNGLTAAGALLLIKELFKDKSENEPAKAEEAMQYSLDVLITANIVEGNTANILIHSFMDDNKQTFKTLLERMNHHCIAKALVAFSDQAQHQEMFKAIKNWGCTETKLDAQIILDMLKNESYPKEKICALADFLNTSEHVVQFLTDLVIQKNPELKHFSETGIDLKQTLQPLKKYYLTKNHHNHAASPEKQQQSDLSAALQFLEKHIDENLIEHFITIKDTYFLTKIISADLIERYLLDLTTHRKDAQLKLAAEHNLIFHLLIAILMKTINSSKDSPPQSAQHSMLIQQMEYLLNPKFSANQKNRSKILHETLTKLVLKDDDHGLRILLTSKFANPIDCIISTLKSQNPKKIQLILRHLSTGSIIKILDELITEQLSSIFYPHLTPEQISEILTQSLVQNNTTIISDMLENKVIEQDGAQASMAASQPNHKFNPDLVRYILNIDLNIPPADIEEGSYIIKLLLHIGLDVSTTDAQGNTIFHLLAERNTPACLDAFESLLNKHSVKSIPWIDAKNTQQKTPLHILIENEAQKFSPGGFFKQYSYEGSKKSISALNLAQMLCAYGAKIDTVLCATCLRISQKHDTLAIKKFFFITNTLFPDVLFDPYSFLSGDTLNRHPEKEIVQIYFLTLLRDTILSTFGNREGLIQCLPLRVAVENNSACMTEMIADFEYFTLPLKAEETALHRACKGNNSKIVEILLSKINQQEKMLKKKLLKPFLNFKDPCGKTPLQVATNPDIIALLLSYGANKGDIYFLYSKKTKVLGLLLLLLFRAFIWKHLLLSFYISLIIYILTQKIYAGKTLHSSPKLSAQKSATRALSSTALNALPKRALGAAASIADLQPPHDDTVSYASYSNCSEEEDERKVSVQHT
jgi:hypothetical protein